MDRIVLSRSPYVYDGADDAIAVVAPGCSPPTGIPNVPLSALLSDPGRWLDRDALVMVVVGLSRMMTPANRVRLGRVLLRPRAGLRRISVDDVLFRSEPWRMWWHFYAVGAADSWGLTDSFLAETRWNRAIEMRTDDPFGLAPVRAAMRGVVRVVDPFRFAPIAVDTVAVSGDVLRDYAELKEDAFTHEKTISAIVRRLARFAQQAVPERSVCSLARLFAKPPARIVRTSLAVDTLLVSQLLDAVALTNAIADGAS